MASDEIIQSVDRAVDILEYILSVGHEVSITEISAGTGMFGSTVYRQLTTLKNRGLVCQNPENAKYWLGLRLYAMGSMVARTTGIIGQIGHQVNELGEKYKLTVYISEPDYSSDAVLQLRVLHRANFGENLLEGLPEVGAVIRATDASSGKCMLAYLSDEMVYQYEMMALTEQGGDTSTDWRELRKELATIRLRGYVLDCDEIMENITTIAVPVLGAKGNPEAVISMAGLTSSIFENPINPMVRDMKSIAKTIIKKAEL